MGFMAQLPYLAVSELFYGAYFSYYVMIAGVEIQHLLTAVENSGEAFLSNAVVGGKFLLRACIVNFHTSLGDIEALPALLSRLGTETDNTLRPELAA